MSVDMQIEYHLENLRELRKIDPYMTTELDADGDFITPAKGIKASMFSGKFQAQWYADLKSNRRNGRRQKFELFMIRYEPDASDVEALHPFMLAFADKYRFEIASNFDNCIEITRLVPYNESLSIGFSARVLEIAEKIFSHKYQAAELVANSPLLTESERSEFLGKMPLAGEKPRINVGVVVVDEKGSIESHARELAAALQPYVDGDVVPMISHRLVNHYLSSGFQKCPARAQDMLDRLLERARNV